MLFNPYNPNLTVERVANIQANAYQILEDGGQITQWTSDQCSVSFDTQFDAEYIIEQCDLYLQQKCPQIYGIPVKKARGLFF